MDNSITNDISVLSLTGVQTTNAGTYKVIASNGLESFTNTAVLTVNTAPTAPSILAVTPDLAGSFDAYLGQTPTFSVQASGDVWFNALPPTIKQNAACDFYHDRAGFYDDKSLFHCPTAKFPKNAESQPDIYFSYAMNSKLEQGSQLTIKVETIKQPSATVFFLENLLPDDPKVDPKQKDIDLGQPSSDGGRFVARHGGVGNIAFVDGHAQGFKGSKVVQTTPGPGDGGDILPQVEIIWTQDPGMTP
jgi:prepilin-type processing-associated H-X9-DG protein